jgi:hypothetical protein
MDWQSSRSTLNTHTRAGVRREQIEGGMRWMGWSGVLPSVDDAATALNEERPDDDPVLKEKGVEEPNENMDEVEEEEEESDEGNTGAPTAQHNTTQTSRVSIRARWVQWGIGRLVLT